MSSSKQKLSDEDIPQISSLDLIKMAWKYRTRQSDRLHLPQKYVNSPVVTNISRGEMTSLLRWIDRHGEHEKIHVDIRGGDVYFREVPNAAHARVAGSISRMLMLFDTEHGGMLLGQDIGSELLIGTDSVLHPDASFTPRNRGHPRYPASRHHRDCPFPTLVVEVGIFESVESLTDLAELYLSPKSDVRLYLGVHLWDRESEGVEEGGWKGVAFLFTRVRNDEMDHHVPTVAISFGTHVVSDSECGWPEGTVQHEKNTAVERAVLPIPTKELYGDQRDGPKDMSSSVNLDLYELQREIDALMW